MPWKRMGSGCIDPRFLDLGTSWRWVVSFTRWPLLPLGKEPQYPLDRRLGGPQSQSGRCGEEKILDPTGTRTLTPVIQSLYWLCYPGSKGGVSIQHFLNCPVAITRGWCDEWCSLLAALPEQAIKGTVGQVRWSVVTWSVGTTKCVGAAVTP
jgi:hypothetical protein